MKTNSSISIGMAAIAFALGGLEATQAVTLDKSFGAQPYLDTALGGTTSAARPELAGTVLEDVIQPFAFQGITGTVQNRVVREDGSGTLDFYWRIQVDPGSPNAAAAGAVSAFRLINFSYEEINDADWRIDGLGNAAPYVGRVFNPSGHPEGAINFLFTDGFVSADNGSRFFFLHTDATEYVMTANYDLLDGSQQLSGLYSTFAPANGVPDAGATSGLLLTGLISFVGGRRWLTRE